MKIIGVRAAVWLCFALGLIGCQAARPQGADTEEIKSRMQGQKEGFMGHAEWSRDIETAMAKARESGKMALVFFNIPQCWECKALRDDGFSDERAQAYIEKHFEPVMILTLTDTETARKMNVNWSPTVLVLDENGFVHYRSEGTQSSIDFLATLHVARGKADFNRKRYDSAIERFDEVINNFSGSTCVAEAYYWKGAAFDKKGDMTTTAKIFRFIAEKYPDTHWGKAASAISRTNY